MTSKSIRNKTFIGRGRSAEVYRIDVGNKVIARKIFTGSRTANFIHAIFYGAPLDYQWCEAAVKAAFFRRKVLFYLVRCWFNETLDIAAPLGWGVEPTSRAYYLDTTYVNGRPAAVCTPFQCDEENEFHQLNDSIMPTLQAHLIKAGMIGTAWQAGKGQPCAIANFLRDPDNSSRWHWIDAESGVPAIAGYHLPSLLKFYLPKALEMGRILFDDLDIDTFRRYLQDNEEIARHKLGKTDYHDLLVASGELITAHQEWGKQTRTSRPLGYFLFKEKITPEEHRFFADHPLKWRLWFLNYFMGTVLPGSVSSFIKKLPSLLRIINPWKWTLFFFKMAFVNSYRLKVSKEFTVSGMEAWKKMGRINENQVQALRIILDTDQANQYLGDFGIHLAVKPLGYILRLTLIPFLWQHGILTDETSAVLFLFCGMILRTTYTLMRCLENVLLLKPPPLLALFFSPLPSIGTLAFPAQMIYSARSGQPLSQFIIYSSLSKTAEHIPIWGGRNTLWDHRLNRLAHWIIVGARKP